MSDSASALFDLMVMLVTSPHIILLFVLLVVAAVIDCRTFRIPNWLTLAGALAGLLSSTINTGRPLDGFLWALAGMGVGLLIMLPFYALRVMGAGDVKLIAAIGAFLGFPAILYAVLFTFVTGGIAALAFAVFGKLTRRMANNLGAIAWSVTLAAITGTSPAASIKQVESVGKLPYAVSIGIGTTAYIVAKQLGFA
jgi:prepilin peptidase CpaA